MLAGFLGLAWHGGLDRFAGERSQGLLTRALTTYTLARSLNAAISVAQGTEIAVQPVGVGVTITAGQVLDPLNDLIERFSWLVLVASASLGLQLLLTEVAGSIWVNGALTVLVALGALAVLWQRCPGREWLYRACLLALLTRFLVAVVTLMTAGANALFLAEREAQAMAQLEQVSQQVEDSNDATTGAATGTADSPQAVPQAEDQGLLGRLGQYFDRQTDAFNIQERLRSLRDQAERATTEVINLIVIFVLQTILLPLGIGWAVLRTFTSISRALLGPGPRPSA